MGKGPPTSALATSCLTPFIASFLDTTTIPSNSQWIRTGNTQFKLHEPVISPSLVLVQYGAHVPGRWRTAVRHSPHEYNVLRRSRMQINLNRLCNTCLQSIGYRHYESPVTIELLAVEVSTSCLFGHVEYEDMRLLSHSYSLVFRQSCWGFCRFIHSCTHRLSLPGSFSSHHRL